MGVLPFRLMVIHFFGPLRELAERETEIRLPGPVRFSEVITALRKKYPALIPYLDKGRESGPLRSVMCMRRGSPLKRDDMVENDDEIKVLLPISGG